MINNDMNFMDTPLPVIIKEYRSSCRPFRKVEESADDFLKFLHRFALAAPSQVKLRHFGHAVSPTLDRIEARVQEQVINRFLAESGAVPFNDVVEKLYNEQLAVFGYILERSQNVELVGGKIIRLNSEELGMLKVIVREKLTQATDSQRDRFVDLLRRHMHKRLMAGSATGVVVAGFGKGELFPTLVAHQLEGFVGNRLRYFRTDHVDIDRNGDRARVLPFAQREMVERFLYGLDEKIERQISQFCRGAIPKLRDEIFANLEMSPSDLETLLAKAKDAEKGFLDGLASETFAAIRQESRSEIEGMVEFMPKPELAKMAEALVNLTSIKRRVSRGMETVGGPIDVAIISRAEGFVWIKRKHYFPEELNHRFFDRMRGSIGHSWREHDEPDVQPGEFGARNGPKSKRPS